MRCSCRAGTGSIVTSISPCPDYSTVEVRATAPEDRTMMHRSAKTPGAPWYTSDIPETAERRKVLIQTISQMKCLGNTTTMLDQEAIDQQQDLLATYRRTLAHWLRQAAQYGGVVYAPPQTANGIDDARRQIKQIQRRDALTEEEQ